MFDSKIDNDILFFKNEKIILWECGYTISDIRNIIETEDKFLFYSNQELYSENIQDLINILDEYPNKQIFISQATSTPHKYSLSPIVNLLHFANKHSDLKNLMKENVVWQFGSYSPGHQNLSYFDFSNKDNYTTFLKSNKGILSVRKENKTRDEIFKLLDFSKFQGIIRYIKLPIKLNTLKLESFTQTEKELNNNPKTSELVKEYCKSFVSFIIETDSAKSSLNPLTEKTILGFMTQTMPVVYGGKNFIKELSDMGFYTFNEELGYTTDDLYYNDPKKINNFVEMVDNYNKLNYSDVKRIYRQNFNKIHRNYNIIWELFSK